MIEAQSGGKINNETKSQVQRPRRSFPQMWNALAEAVTQGACPNCGQTMINGLFPKNLQTDSPVGQEADTGCRGEQQPIGDLRVRPTPPPC